MPRRPTGDPGEQGLRDPRLQLRFQYGSREPVGLSQKSRQFIQNRVFRRQDPPRLSDYPYRRFVLYLIASGLSDVEIREALSARALPLPWGDYLGFLRALAPFPPGWSCSRRRRLWGEHRAWLEELGIVGYWCCAPDGPEEVAEGLLYQVVLRADLEQLLLTGAELSVVAARLEAAHGAVLSEEVLAAYQHYFWDTRLVPRHELGGLLDLYRDRGLRRVAAHGGLQALYHLTGVEAHVDQVRMVTDAAQTAYFKLLELGRRPAGPRNATTMAQYARQLYAGIAMLRQLGGETEDIREQFREFQLTRPQTVSIPPLRLVRGGVVGGGLESAQDADFEEA